MDGIRHVAVVDIGKTNAKLALVDLARPAEIAVRKTPNSPLKDGPYPHHDVERLWDFILESLAALRREHPIDAVCVTTHGATAALLAADGGLAMPVLDYEHEGPDAMRAAYDAIRPAFEESGSPPLPCGLNLGAQFLWQSRTFPDAFARVTQILMYPQYWAWRLSGVAANEVSSLGCHTDLWSPIGQDYSTLVDRMGWRALFAPMRPARDRLGPLLPEIAEQTGIEFSTPVFCGVHDSNASLLPHLLSRKPPFAVVSSGTWVVAMAIGGRKVVLDPTRDTLINVNALGDSVPSARFMGGREFEIVASGAASQWRPADIDAVLAESVMLLPSVKQGCGPFPDRIARWTVTDEPAGRQRFVAVSFYLALMTATCLELIGAEGDIVVEGTFAGNEPYLLMLSAATGRQVLRQSRWTTGTSIGAALIAGPKAQALQNPEALTFCTAALREYALQWIDNNRY